MFEETKNDGTANLPDVPANLPVPPSGEPSDMFEAAEPVANRSESSPQPSEPSPMAPSPALPGAVPQPMLEARTEPRIAPLAPVTPERSSGVGVFLVIFGVLFLILVVLGVSAFFAYRAFILAPEEEPTEVPLIVIPEDEPEPPIEVEEPIVSTTLDTDNDGLTDAEEARYGTDAERADTDNDGLPDKDEVQKYGTDPIDPDTDGDTFLDGVEVISGYDPKGPGKLVDLPK